MSETPPNPAASPAIEVTGLQCGYEGRTVLKDLHFTVKRGEVFFIIGGSGCGKSTLLRNLVGLNTPQAGGVKFFGRSFSDADLTARRELLKTFGVLFQGGALWTSLTLRQNVALPLEEHTALSAREIAELTSLKLAQVGLTGFEDYYPSEISGGMRKRAGLARALALDPAIVFLDEPSAGLDPITCTEINDLINEVQHRFNTSSIIITHDLTCAKSTGDTIAVLKEGRFIRQGNFEDVFSSDEALIREFYEYNFIQ